MNFYTIAKQGNLAVLAAYLKTLLAFALILMFCANLANAQTIENPYNLNYVPPSPNAVSLGKFGEYPVSMATGVPTIAVPLFGYKGGSNQLSLNLALSYHAGGIRVEEISSNIGSGWALNAGGVISRTVRGLPDDMPIYGYMTLFPVQEPVRDIEGHYTLAEAYAKNARDGEQDMFNFNFNGRSGKFILKGNGDAVLLTKEAIKIKTLKSPGSTGLPIVGFIITDENGVNYTFKEAETTQINMSALLSMVTYTSSWYLTSISSAVSSDQITFSYVNNVNYCHNFSSETAENLGISGTSVLTFPTIYEQPAGTDYTVVTKKIKQINLPNSTRFNFVYAPLTRCDLKGDSILMEIRQQDAVTGSYSSMKLYQSYMDQYGLKHALSPAPCDLNSQVNSTGLRLRLDSVQQFSNGKSLNPHRFEYNDSQILPATDSRKQDFWGFYNGSRNTSGHLVPTYFHQSYILESADRYVDTIAVSAGMLRKITYPTKGHTEFLYEANRAGNKITTYQINNAQVNANPFNHVTPFVLNRTTNFSEIEFKFNMTAWCPDVSTSCTFNFSIKSADNSITYASHTFGYSELNTTKVYPLSIPNGSYNLTWELDPSCSCNDMFGFNLSYQVMAADTIQFFGGGARIREIKSYDGVSHANDMVKRYSYVHENGLSSGYAAEIPKFDYTYMKCVPIPGQSELQPQYYLVRTAATNYPLTYSSGGVNYGRVELRNIGPENQGKEVHYFTSYKEYPPFTSEGTGATFEFPYEPLQTYDWMLGLPVKQELFNSSDVRIKKTVNVFQQDIQYLDSLKNIKLGARGQERCTLGTPNDFPLYQWKIYNSAVGRAEKTKSIVVEYIGADSIVNISNYSYHPNYYTLSSVSTINSKTDTVITNHFYPFDYNGVGVFSAMVDSNIIASTVSNELWKYKNGTKYLIDGDATSFAKYGQAYLPQDYYRIITDVPVSVAVIGEHNPNYLLRNTGFYRHKIHFSNYDIKGNPLLINQNNKRTAMIWGYNGQSLVAQINNADSLGIAYTSFEDSENGNWSVGSVSRNTFVSHTGIKSYDLGNGNISISGLSSSKTYVVSYWSRNGIYSLTNGGTPVTGPVINGWTYYEHHITGTSGLTISGAGLIDELRLFPIGAQMQTFTHDPIKGVRDQSDAKGNTSYYEYDDFYRLTAIKDHQGYLVKTIEYNYIGQAQANWQNTLTALRCKLNGNGQNTGEQEREQRDINPNSPSYNQTRWISAGTNTGACPLPQACNPVVCNNGTNQKCVNGNCETGIKVYTDSIYNWGNGMYTCYYHYEFSDGTWSSTFTEESAEACAF